MKLFHTGTQPRPQRRHRPSFNHYWMVKKGSAMDRQEILSVLNEYKQESAVKYGIVDLGIFGSAVRDDFSDDSDVDVVVRIEKPDLFLLAGIKQDLEERFHRPVDLVTYRDTMNPFLKQKIDGEAVYAQ